MEAIDVAIIGAGPAGLQAALVLARTRKNVVVFDAPTPPRNAASHGVHNFIGLDGLLPQEIRDQAWNQIEVGTLLFTPDEEPAPLITSLIDTLGLHLDDTGHVDVDASQQTNVDRLWAAGDVQGWMGGIESANADGMAAFMIVHDWYPTSDGGTW